MILVLSLACKCLMGLCKQGREKAVVLVTPTTNDITPHPKVKQKSETPKGFRGGNAAHGRKGHKDIADHDNISFLDIH